MGSISVAQVKAPQVGFTAVDGTESRSYMKIWPKPLAGSDPEAGLEPEAPRRVGGNSQAGRDARRGLSCAGRKPSGRRRWRRTAVAPARAAGAARARGRCPQSSRPSVFGEWNSRKILGRNRKLVVLLLFQGNCWLQPPSAGTARPGIQSS
ncbi:prefoldin subunit 2 isoform X3 [Papio anubis]|uniref:prefoldin subunit 2 isoform X3 n=1 Tax=Papio anubis TaxID=9555 RepID=UPI0012AE7846|nr:prefoldin subunit 2 isoform X3 [Papio anubis]